MILIAEVKGFDIFPFPKYPTPRMKKQLVLQWYLS